MADRENVDEIAQQLVAGMSPDERRALLHSIMGGAGDSGAGDSGEGPAAGGGALGLAGALGMGSALGMAGGSPFPDPFRAPEPTLADVPERVRGLRVRVDLCGAKPPVWRRLELPGDITLDRLHVVIQAAMGWYDAHLHAFRTSNVFPPPRFLTRFDIEQEGEEGLYEGDARLDQVLTTKGDRLWYDYDFGDDWEHVIELEAVLGDPPAAPRLVTGRMACPPEDCGGIWGYQQLSDWVRGGYDVSSVPDPFDNAEHARDWLPPRWHPDGFDLAETQEMVSAAFAAVDAEPGPVPKELGMLLARLESRGDRALTMLLARPVWQGTTGVDRAAVGEVVVDEAEIDEAAVNEVSAGQLLAPFFVLLDAIGDGVPLTGAGYLKPALVQRLADETGASEWWIGKANREDQTMPVARLREAARQLGLVSVRKGRISVTATARRHRNDPVALWRHIASRLPVGRQDFDREAGWLTLVVVGSGIEHADWDREIRDLLVSLGWGIQGRPVMPVYAVHNPTLDALKVLGGATRNISAAGGPAMAATARAAIGHALARE